MQNVWRHKNLSARRFLGQQLSQSDQGRLIRLRVFINEITQQMPPLAGIMMVRTVRLLSN